MSGARQARKHIAEETLAILNAGTYSVHGLQVDLSEALKQCAMASTVVREKAATRSHTPKRVTMIDVVEQGALASAQALVTQGYSVAVLNFASAKNPGGGFLNGAEAQEENIARNSALYTALTAPQITEHYTRQRSLLKGGDGLYTHDLIYSPAVPVLREEDGTLLSTPWRAAFISAAAPNAGVARGHNVSDRVIGATLAARAECVLALAAAHNHDAVVLGAWGCGVFKNDPSSVAKTFAELLHGKFAGVFTRVTFAILGPEANRAPFAATFAAPHAAAVDAPASEPAVAKPPPSKGGGRGRQSCGRRGGRVQHGWKDSNCELDTAAAASRRPEVAATGAVQSAEPATSLAPASGSPSRHLERPAGGATSGGGGGAAIDARALDALRVWAAPPGNGPAAELVDVGVNAHSLKQPWLPRAAAAGVTRFLLTGCSLKGSMCGRELAEAGGAMADGAVALRFTAGVHPHDASSWSEHTAARISTLAAHAACGAVGECGLDYDRMRGPREIQLAAFAAQAALAVRLGKPLFLHCRDLDAARGAPLGAYADLLRVLHDAGAPPTSCCVHCFTGSLDELRTLVEGGFVVGLTGFICKGERGAELRSALQTLAAERGAAHLVAQLVLETDAPYMRPPDGVLPKQAFGKGRDAEPAMTRAVCHTVAECLGLAPEVVAEATTKRAVALFW